RMQPRQRAVKSPRPAMSSSPRAIGAPLTVSPGSGNDDREHVHSMCSCSRELSSLARSGQCAIGRATPEPSLHLCRVGAEERTTHPAVARLELRVLDILGEIGGLRKEVIDAKAAGEAPLDGPGGSIVAGGEKR